MSALHCSNRAVVPTIARFQTIPRSQPNLPQPKRFARHTGFDFANERIDHWGVVETGDIYPLVLAALARLASYVFPKRSLYPANAKINTAAANRVVETHKSAGLLASSIDPAGLLNLSRPIVEMTATGSAAEQPGQLGGRNTATDMPC